MSDIVNQLKEFYKLIKKRSEVSASNEDEVIHAVKSVRLIDYKELSFYSGSEGTHWEPSESPTIEMNITKVFAPTPTDQIIVSGDYLSVQNPIEKDKFIFELDTNIEVLDAKKVKDGYEITMDDTFVGYLKKY